MSDDTIVTIAVIAVLLAHLAALLWVLIRRRGIKPVLILNLLVAAGELAFVGPQLPEEIAFKASDILEYKMTIWSTFELAVLIVSAVAFWGARPARILAWIGFAGNFVLSVLAFALWLLLLNTSFAWH